MSSLLYNYRVKIFLTFDPSDYTFYYCFIQKGCSSAIISAGDYRDATENAQKGDFVYLDPPYHPASSTSNFTTYMSNGFGREDQVQLANVFTKLANRGCLVLLSNSDTPFIRELYSDFSVKEVKAQRAINCKGFKAYRP